MLLFLDGQAHYDTTRIAMKYSKVDTTNVIWSVVPEGRFGNCIKRVSTSRSTFGHLGISPLTTRLAPWTPTKSGVCGFAIKVDDLQRAIAEAIIVVDGNEFFTVMEGAAAHVGVILNPDGTFSLYRSRPTSGIDLLAVSSEGLQSGAWAYIEFKWFIHPTNGTFEIRANGVPIMNYLGNTQDSRQLDILGVWNSVHLLYVEAENNTNPIVLRMCDLYLADLDAADPDDVSDFLGDGIVETIMPNAPGAAANWTPNTGANWDATNERAAPDNDTTYVATTTPGTKDLYHFEDITPGAIVKAAHVCVMARKEDEGTSSIAPIVHQGTTDYLGPTQGVPSLVYDRYITQPWDLNPATGAKFTVAEINAGQFGVQKIS
jgi:hypothetical protein